MSQKYQEGTKPGQRTPSSKVPVSGLTRYLQGVQETVEVTPHQWKRGWQVHPCTQQSLAKGCLRGVGEDENSQVSFLSASSLRSVCQQGAAGTRSWEGRQEGRTGSGRSAHEPGKGCTGLGAEQPQPQLRVSACFSLCLFP